MALRGSESRISLAVALLIALSGACGGDDDDDGVPAQYDTVPGPSIPQPPPERDLTAEGTVTITLPTGEVSSAPVVTKVEMSGAYAGRETGFRLTTKCGQTLPDSEVYLYVSRGTNVLVIERTNNRWHANRLRAEVVPSPPPDVDAPDAGSTADAGDAGDADAAPAQPEPAFVDGIGLPGTDGRREIAITLVERGTRYDVRATIPWLASSAPATCQQLRPGTGTRGSSDSGGGGCGGGSSSRRSSGGDWD